MFKPIRFFSFLLCTISFFYFDGSAFEFEDLIGNCNANEFTGVFPERQNIDDGIINSNITYILYARPGGVLGTQLNNFFNAVKAQHLNDPPVLTYPPHVTLTGFFPTKNPGNPEQENLLIQALQTAIANAPKIIPIQIGKNIVESRNLDYIPITSSKLHDLSVNFLKLAGLESNLIRPKPGTKLGYHITLRQDTQGSTTAKVRKLEKSNINLSKKGLQANTTWALYIYKRTDKKLTILYQQSITTQ